jgi:murein DD-endopeptidase MepM/ murein hydrolase activator NlpD
MRRLTLLAAVAMLGLPALAAARPAPMPVQVQLSLRTMIADMERLAPAGPDLTMLTTEPVSRSESSGYGWREDPIKKRQKFHHGTDYRGKTGTPILAAGAGTVVFAGRRGGYGNAVFVDHGNGVVTRYAHMRRIETKVGATIAAGQRIGQLGSTGRTTGPHLHFEVRLEGRSVDPSTALTVAEIMRESPAAGHLAAFALAPELQANARDMQDRKNQRALRALTETPSRPERKHAPKRSRALW